MAHKDLSYLKLTKKHHICSFSNCEILLWEGSNKQIFHLTFRRRKFKLQALAQIDANIFLRKVKLT